jgi:DNA-directed RNA polymerase specialized sigma24 family protein
VELVHLGQTLHRPWFALDQCQQAANLLRRLGRDALERADRLARLGRAIAALPDDQRAVLALFEWEGLDYVEIAAIEEVPVGTVRSRLHRAREALRAALADDAPAVRARLDQPQPGGRRVVA